MKKWSLLSAMIAVVVLTSCFQKALTPKEYFNWARSNESGLMQTKAGNGVSFQMQFRPADLMIANEIKNGSTAEQDYITRKEALGDLAYFLLKIESGEQDLLMHKVADEQEYVRRVNYYSLDFQYDIVAVCGGDTLPCVMYQFENAYGITPYINISLAFPGQLMKSNESASVQLLVNDRVFGNGIMKYDYELNAFSDLPELIIE